MTGTVSPQVRPATSDDALALAMIEVESLGATSDALRPPGHQSSPSVEERMREWSDWPADHPDDVLLVYDKDGRTDGLIDAEAGAGGGSNAAGRRSRSPAGIRSPSPCAPRCTAR